MTFPCGPGALADAASRHLDAAQQWLARHLAEMATLGEPGAEQARRVYVAVYQARAGERGIADGTGDIRLGRASGG
jgi:hypothetical protein